MSKKSKLPDAIPGDNCNDLLDFSILRLLHCINTSTGHVTLLCFHHYLHDEIIHLTPGVSSVLPAKLHLSADHMETRSRVVPTVRLPSVPKPPRYTLGSESVPLPNQDHHFHDKYVVPAWLIRELCTASSHDHRRFCQLQKLNLLVEPLSAVNSDRSRWLLRPKVTRSASKR